MGITSDILPNLKPSLQVEKVKLLIGLNNLGNFNELDEYCSVLSSFVDRFQYYNKTYRE